MKAYKYLKVILGISLIASIGLVSLDVLAQTDKKSTTEIVDDINITIDKTTSDEDFEDISATLKPYNINIEFSNVVRNDLQEITGIAIKLFTDSGQQAMSQISSTMPISEISFGSKNGSLYVGQGDQQLNMFALFNGNSRFQSTFDQDSIFGGHFQQFDLSDFFNDDDAFFMFNGDSLDIKQLRDKMMQRFNYSSPQGDRFSFLFNDNDNFGNNGTYRFIDDPDKEKVIIIDGESSDFETLDQLAKSDKIETVDVLKPETAMSLYGKKAKDGAIIVTTK